MDPLPWLQRLPGLSQALLGKRAALAQPDQSPPLLFLRLPRASASLGSQRFSPTSVHRSRAWVLGLQAGPANSPSSLPALPAGPAQLVWDDHGWPEVHFSGMRLGCGCHPLARDWAWAWTPTYGPVILRLHLNASPQELADFVEAQCPGLWQPRDGVQLFSGLSDDCRMLQSPGTLVLSRGYLTPLEAQVAADHQLLLALAHGALGELEFDLFDGDYHVFKAAGYSCQSLWDYLHAQAAAGKKHRWNRFPEIDCIDARSADVQTSASAIARGLSWEEPGLEALLERLRTTPVQQLPRCIRITISEPPWNQALRYRFLTAQPRVMFWWTLDQ